ncbi:hypothetical protein BpHYR1_028211 [Brachionus plicatilis]|uniref:Uncharacterized protein n=1 Tax=Brachionus plicatilis TaxID=10195 RepID=A0A3M7QZU9_BRAPC|nr:hypothetical protein BpHYR1_028211 [Brachionus plicatilis]
MMLMTKFGKFKLRLVATINLSVLLSLLNIASATSNYWLMHVDNGVTHYTGLFRSCHSTQCFWRNGIVGNNCSTWSVLVRVLITLGTITNISAVVVLIVAFVYKINKRSKVTIKLMEYANLILVSSFLFLFIGFVVFISNKCNFSIWLQSMSMIILIITSNMLTRTFSSIYFQNTRLTHCNKSCDTAVSNAKLSIEQEKGLQNEKAIGKSREELNQNQTQNKNTIEMNQMVNEDNKEAAQVNDKQDSIDQ